MKLFQLKRWWKPVAPASTGGHIQEKLEDEPMGLQVLGSRHAGAPTAVVFSSVNSNGFSYFKLFEPFRGRLNCIFVRDPYDAWYTRGVGQGGESFGSLLETIRGQLDLLDPSRIMTFGSSMGAYAALRMSFATKVDLCVATSPQTILDTRLPHTPSFPVPSEDYDLAQIAESVSTENTLLFSGAADFVDQFNLSRVRWSGAQHLPIADHDHLVAQLLHRTGIYSRLIEGFIQGKTLAELASSVDARLDDRCSVPEAQDLISKVVNTCYRGAKWDMRELLGQLSEFGEWADGHHLMARSLAKNNALEPAIGHARRAVELAPSSVTIADTLASLYASAGRLDEAVQAYQRCLQIRPKHYSALCALAEIHRKTGKRSEAISLLHQAIAIRPRLERARILLSTIEGTP